MVGTKIGNMPLIACLYFREVDTFICVSALAVCNHQSLSQAPSSPSSVSS